jgi:hypothetical protein
MRLPRPRPWWAAVLIVFAASGIAKDLMVPPRHDIVDAVPDTLRALAAAVALFGVTGLGVTRLLLPESLRRHELLWVLPTGACVTGLALMALGFAYVPFSVSLPVVAVAGIVLSVVALRRTGRPAAGRGLWWPVFLALVIAGLALTPMVMHMHIATVTGTGSDAHMAAGSANFLQHAYPTSVEPELPVDRMPLLWKSKYPIYYAFGGVARVAGLETWQVLAPLAAVLLALAAIGMFLVARDLLGAPAWVAVYAMGFAGFDRMVLHTGLNPYFNQTWGYFAMPFAIVLAWWLVRPGEPPGQRKRTAVLVGLFLAILAFAYPLALPFAAMPLLVFLWRERRKRIAEGRPVPRLRSLYRGPLSLLYLVPLALVLLVPLKGVNEKLSSVTHLVLDPGQSLIAWAADLQTFIPMTYFINLPNQTLFRLAMVAIVVLAFRELRRHQPRALYIGLGIVLALGLYEAGSFRQREYGYYFNFKILAFVAPLLLVLAAVQVGRFRRWGPWVLALFALATSAAVRTEVRETGYQLGSPTIELAEWADELPPGASVRLDMTGPLQLWGGYFLAARRTCSEEPLLTSDYPHVAQSTKADYVVVHHGYQRPPDAVGPPLRENVDYSLYRLDPDIPGPDRCSFVQQSRVEASQIPG